MKDSNLDKLSRQTRSGLRDHRLIVASVPPPPAMQSLRTRRSQAPAPRKGQRSGAKLVGRSDSSRKSRVDDRIKKRMSMRYADISGPVDVPPMPPMPTMGRAREDDDDVVYNARSAPRDAPTAEDDKKLLDKDDFDPDACE